MKFINEGKTKQVRQNEGLERHSWKLLKTGEIIDLSEDVGVRYGLKKVGSDQKLPKVTEGKIGKKKVETKQIENKDNIEFYKKLRKIKGIGRKTVEDIIAIYPTEADLIKEIKNKERLPFRDDVEKKLRRKYGG